MGAAGISLPLVPLRRQKEPTPRVVAAVLDTLGSAWGSLGSWKEAARSWIHQGDDSLLTVQAQPGGLIFWFDESVDWPEALAEHWLHVALAWRRRDFERELFKLGFAVPSGAWPRVFDLAAKGSRFIAIDGRIGIVSDDRVKWIAGRDDEAPESVAIAELPDEARERVALLAERCLCPYCERLHQLLVPTLTLEPGNVLIREEYGRFTSCLTLRDGSLLATESDWTQRKARDEQSWNMVGALSNPKQILHLVHEVGDMLVALVSTGGVRRRHFSAMSSSDGGVTWSKPLPCGLPELSERESPRFYVGPHRSDIVFGVTSDAQRKSVVYRSDDGGCTFGAGVTPLFDGLTATHVRDVFGFGDRVVALFQDSQTWQLAASDDGGHQFTRIAEAEQLWATVTGEMVCRNASGLMHSRDQGRTWTTTNAPAFAIDDACFGPRWFVRGHVTTKTGHYLYKLGVSDDQGTTWSEIASGNFGPLFADGADPRSIYVDGGSMNTLLMRIRPQSSPAATS